jgi:hypothetical protein
MPSLFEVVSDQVSENHDAIPSPFDAGPDSDATINNRRAASENAEALRLARAL